MKTRINNIISASFIFLMMMCMAACTDDNVSGLQLSGDCTIVALTLDDYEGKVDFD